MDKIGPCEGDSIFKFLTTGSSIEMNVDGGTPVNFKFVNTNNRNAYLVRACITMVDASMTPIKFGGVAALTNGVDFGVYDDSDVEKLNFTDGEPIKSNIEFGSLAGIDVNIGDFGASDALSIRWTMARAGGAITIPPNWYFQAKVQDDLSALTQFRIMVQGFYS